MDGSLSWKPETHHRTPRTTTAPLWSLLTLPFLGWSAHCRGKADQAVTASPFLARFLKQLKLPTVLSSFLLQSMWKWEAQQEGVSLQEIHVGLIKMESCVPLGLFFEEGCLTGLTSRLWMRVTMFPSKQGRKGCGLGSYRSPYQSVLLHTSLPISRAMPAPNKQVTSEVVHLASFLHLVFATKDIMCFYALELAIQFHKSWISPFWRWGDGTEGLRRLFSAE